MKLKNKKTILIFVDWYLPGYKAGGPIKSIFAIVNYLKDDFNFLIITTDKDFGDTKSYSTVQSDTWNKINESVSVFYGSEHFLTRKNIFNLIKSVQFDLIYLNSFFSLKFSIYPLWLIKSGKVKSPVLLAPRGMLGKGALKLKSKKKKIFLVISKLLSLHKSIFWQATSKQEEMEIRLTFGERHSIINVPNMQYNESIKPILVSEKKSGEVKLFFLSRISEKKNLLFALKVLAEIKVKESKIDFDIIGPIEDESYWSKCKEIISQLPDNIKVNYKLAIPNSEVPKVISAYHFLFLPTFNENYGHVIVESFISGKPVLISNQTPWRNLYKENAGFDLSVDDITSFVDAVNEIIHMNSEQYDLFSKGALDYAKKYCISSDSVELTKNMFNIAMKND